MSMEVPFKLLNDLIRAQERAAAAEEQLAAYQKAITRPLPLRKEFAPVFGVGDTVRILKAGESKNIEIFAVQALPHHRHDFGSLTSGTNLRDRDETHLDMPNGEMAQYRFMAMGEFEVEFSHPGSTVGAWRTDSQNFRITPSFLHVDTPIQERDWMWAASEFWVFETETPRFHLIPFASAIGAQAHIDFYGIRYAWKALPSPGEPQFVEPQYTLRVNAWPSVA